MQRFRICLFRVAIILLAGLGAVAGQAPTQPFVPQPIVPGGQIVALFPPTSKYLKKERLGEAEQNNLQKTVPGRIQSIVNIQDRKSVV